MKKSKTPRGFSIYKFNDRNNQECSLQKSSLATEDAIWLGVDEDPNEDLSIFSRMHLTKGQVKKLLPLLQNFVKTGEI